MLGGERSGKVVAGAGEEWDNFGGFAECVCMGRRSVDVKGDRWNEKKGWKDAGRVGKGGRGRGDG